MFCNDLYRHSTLIYKVFVAPIFFIAWYKEWFEKKLKKSYVISIQKLWSCLQNYQTFRQTTEAERIGNCHCRY